MVIPNDLFKGNKMPTACIAIHGTKLTHKMLTTSAIVFVINLKLQDIARNMENTWSETQVKILIQCFLKKNPFSLLWDDFLGLLFSLHAVVFGAPVSLSWVYS